MIELPLPSRALSDRLMRVDIAYTMARMRVIEAREGNPYGILFRQMDGVTALMARRITFYLFNRILGLRDGQSKLLAELDDWYLENGVSCRIDIAPGDLTPALGRALTQRGYFQSGFHISVYGLPDAAAPDCDIEVIQVHTAELMQTFLAVYFAGWGFPESIWATAEANMRGWLAQPAWRLLLARVDGKPAAVAKLYLHDRVGYFADATTHPDFRRRGLQTALLHYRSRLAAEGGAELTYSQAEFGSSSHRNMERIGMRVLHTRAVWTRAAVL